VYVALAIRTVTVTTASAVRTHREEGNDHLIRGTVARGLAVLESVKAKLGTGTDAEVDRMYTEARHELRSLAEDVEPRPAAAPR
jgi:hypothetical protein